MAHCFFDEVAGLHMKAKQTYVVLAGRGSGWEIHGPIATEYSTLKEAEKAAHDLSARYPTWTIGVYELRTVFGTQQKVVKQKVEPSEPLIKRKARMVAEQTAPAVEAENVIKLRTTN
jgi:hypothetical protein